MGKSRLLAEFRERLQGRAVTVLEGACRAIDLNGSLAEARDKMRASGVVLEA